MKNNRLIAMIEAAFFAVIALLIDLLPAIHITPSVDISFAMVPIFILAFRWGMKVSMLSGFLWGLLQVATGNIFFLSIDQFLIEYFIAFAFVGMAGLFYPVIQKNLGSKQKLAFWMVAAVLVGSLARYFWHFVAGIIYWGDYAPEGTSPFIYSLVVNGGAMLGSAVFCAVILVILISVSKRLIIRS